MNGIRRGFMFSSPGVRARVVILSVFVLALFSTSFAVAGTIYTFAVSGTADSDSRPENAKATIDLSTDQMIITLENTAGVGELGSGSSVLTGFSFTFSTAPDSITLTGVAVAGNPSGYTCASGSCSPLYTFEDSSPYGWTISEPLATPLLAAGNASYKPYGIVNYNLDASGGGNLDNHTHVPYLNGPVTFTLALTGLLTTPEIIPNTVTFYFGTVPDTQVVPIPGAVWLLGSGLLGFLGVRRKFLG